MANSFEVVANATVPIGGQVFTVDCEGLGIVPLGSNTGGGGITVLYDNAAGLVRTCTIDYLDRNGNVLMANITFTTFTAATKSLFRIPASSAKMRINVPAGATTLPIVILATCG